VAHLAIDTCHSRLTLALSQEGRDIVSVSQEIGIGHAERIAPAFQHLLRGADTQASAITRIGVTVGPGSFMGQRVGIAFAKGVAMASSAKTVPITTLEAFAASAEGRVAVAIDARRGEVYLQRFEASVPLEEPRMVSYPQAAAELSESLILGNASQALGIPFSGPDHIEPESLLKLTAGKQPGALRTLYLRAPDAKPSRPVLS
jgi:tRNA threonylcarbamoyladenosine biosynthesis protein TsaB